MRRRMPLPAILFSVAAVLAPARAADAPGTDPDPDRGLVAWTLASVEAAQRKATFADVSALGAAAAEHAGVRLELLDRGRSVVDVIRHQLPTLAGNLRGATVELADRLPSPDALRRHALVITVFALLSAPSDKAADPFPPPARAVDGLDALYGWLDGRRALLTPTDLWRRNGDAEPMLGDLFSRLLADGPAPAEAASVAGTPEDFSKHPGFQIETAPARVIAHIPDGGDGRPSIRRLARFDAAWSHDAVNAEVIGRAAAQARAWLAFHAAGAGAEAAAPDAASGAPPNQYDPGNDLALGQADAAGLLLAAAALAGPAADAAQRAVARRLFDVALSRGYREDPVTGRGHFRAGATENADRERLARLALRALASPGFVAPDPVDPNDAELPRIARALAGPEPLAVPPSGAAGRTAWRRGGAWADRLLTADARGLPPPDAGERLRLLTALAALPAANADLPEAILAGARLYPLTRRQEVADAVRAWCDRLVEFQRASPELAGNAPLPGEDDFFDLSPSPLQAAGHTLDDADRLAFTARATGALSEAAGLFAQLGDRPTAVRWAAAAKRGARALLRRQTLTIFDGLWCVRPEAASGGVREAAGSGRQDWELTALTALALESAKDGLALAER